MFFAATANTFLDIWCLRRTTMHTLMKKKYKIKRKCKMSNLNFLFYFTRPKNCFAFRIKFELLFCRQFLLKMSACARTCMCVSVGFHPFWRKKQQQRLVVTKSISFKPNATKKKSRKIARAGKQTNERKQKIWMFQFFPQFCHHQKMKSFVFISNE